MSDPNTLERILYCAKCQTQTLFLETKTRYKICTCCGTVIKSNLKNRKAKRREFQAKFHNKEQS